MELDIPGTAWFRHQARKTRKALGIRQVVDEKRGSFSRWNPDPMERTYALVSGGRAVSENLQLDCLLPEAEADVATVELKSIKGITVAAFDWTSMNKKQTPEEIGLRC